MIQLNPFAHDESHLKQTTHFMIFLTNKITFLISCIIYHRHRVIIKILCWDILLYHLLEYNNVNEQIHTQMIFKKILQTVYRY